MFPALIAKMILEDAKSVKTDTLKNFRMTRAIVSTAHSLFQAFTTMLLKRFSSNAILHVQNVKLNQTAVAYAVKDMPKKN